MSMSEGIQRLLAILTGLGFTCTNINCKNKNAQRKLSRQINEWLSIIIWTTITAYGPLPKGAKAVKTILIGKGQGEVLWKMKKTPRYKNRDKFAERFRRRVETIIKLGRSFEHCQEHPGPMIPVVDEQDCINWQCTHNDCTTRIPVDPTLSNQIKSETSARFWNAKKV